MDQDHNSAKHVRPRNREGKINFEPHFRPGDTEISATDALLIAELDSTYAVSGNEDAAEPLIITTPNADYLPFIDLGSRTVQLKRDGRWGAEDWTQWPQWFFDEFDYFPYVLRRPNATDLPVHPLRRIWWNMKEADFIKENGYGSSDVGRLNPSIVEEFDVLHADLTKRVLACDCDRSSQTYGKLKAAAAGLQDSVSLLRDTPQSSANVRATVAIVQRLYLETRALLDKIEKWDRLSTLQQKHKTNPSIVGTVTDRLGLVYDFFAKGVPVWLVRPPALIPRTINIVKHGALTRPSAAFGIVDEPWPKVPPFYEGELSPAMYGGLHKWNPGAVCISNVVSANGSDRQERYTPDEEAQPSRNPRQHLEPFRPSLSPFSSQPLLEWENALRSVESDKTRIVDHPLKAIYEGYAFPNPYLAFTGDDKETTAFILAWLLTREEWINSMTNVLPTRQIPLPRMSEWTSYLRDIELDFNLGEKHTKAWRRNIRRKAKEIKDKFPCSHQALDVSAIEWNGHEVWRKGSVKLDLFDRRMLYYDVQEHNFRMELHTLDRCIMADEWENTSQAVTRHRKVLAVFPEGSLLAVTFIPGSPRLANEKWKIRAPYVEAFRALISDWPGDVPRELAGIRMQSGKEGDRVIWSKDKMRIVERKAYTFYCQTYFDYFGRTPSIPHVLPVKDT
ncbi:hypothetical protein NP233_g2127 [Leucocoprinus birnbaumii]|uniref:Uncharacterized protein n=1 Tax=Leucocoprinus birnbaumii TaxID=56174 RepID=A0AAD5YV69_9AGAR|nr:hypothetical protein NP233_g2127 [Leucocoprinus birnbaumii]